MSSGAASSGVMSSAVTSSAVTSGETAAVEIALVHRPRYDDWSLPKGKPELGEHLLQTAVREVAEETGHGAVLGRALGSTSYRVAVGVKTVRWWAAAADGGDFAPSREVDELRWCAPTESLRLLTHAHDHGPLLALLQPRPATTTVLLVRHGRAGDRAAWPGDDRTRPLDDEGRGQADRLRTVLPVFAPRRVLAADRARCVQTVEPLARAVDVPVELEPALTDDAVGHSLERGVARLRALAATGDPVVVCSQGGAIPALLAALSSADGVDLGRGGKVASRKGSTWVLAFADQRLVGADYLPDLSPALPG